MNPIQEPAAMNPIQEYLIPQPIETIPYTKKCPPPPPSSTSPIGDWPIEAPTEMPRSRSGGLAPVGAEPTHTWADVVLPDEPQAIRRLTTCSWSDVSLPDEPKAILQLTEQMEPILHSRQGDDIIHPDIGRILIRQRGTYWWENSQHMLEKQFSSGRQPMQGGFYVFLEEEQSGNVIRFGNVLQGVVWVMQTVAFPKGHPDADVPPYQMIDVRE